MSKMIWTLHCNFIILISLSAQMLTFQTITVQ